MDYYTNYITSRDDWIFVGMYSDEGITATNTKRREGFNQMIEDAELMARYEKAKAKNDDIAEQIESKKAKRELFKGFIRTLEKQDGITYEFDAGIWSSLVQEVIVKSKDDIRFIFKNGFEVRV